MADGAGVLSPPLPKKKLPFKPTALRKAAAPQPSGDGKAADDDLELFRRSKEMAPIVAADQERRRRRRQKLKEEERRRRSSGEKRPLDLDDEPRDDDDDEPGSRGGDGAGDLLTTDESMTVQEDSFRDMVTPPPSKRSRIDSTSSKKPITNIEDAELMPDDSPSSRLLRSLSKPSSAGKRPVYYAGDAPPSGQAPILIDSDPEDDEDGARQPETPSRARDSSLEIIGSVSPGPSPLPEDDEFAEYVRKAEEQRARDQALLGGGSGSASAGADSGTPADKEKTDILISSTLPDSRPCVFKFLFDKPLRLVRDSWIAVQVKHGVPLPPDVHADVMLTWRRRRVYNSSTLLNLGIRPQGDGRLTATPAATSRVRGASGRDGLSEDRTRVHLEAWTPELFREMEREMELQRRQDAGELSDGDGGAADGGSSASASPPPEVKLKVILRARGMEDVGLTARPETTAETLVTGFRRQMGLAMDREVALYFDGDRLEEHVTMDEAGIEDLDSIEVHVK